MADLSSLQATDATRIVGADASGVETNPVNADVLGNMFTVVNNSSGASAVNVQDGGNSLTVDSPQLPASLGATTSAGSISVVPATDSQSITLTGTATANGVNAVASGDIGAFDDISVQITGTFVATVTFQGSNDNVNFVSVNAQTVASGTTGVVQTANAVGIFQVPIKFKYFRVRTTAYTSGTVTVTAVVSVSSANDLGLRSVSQTGTWTVTPANTANTTPWLVNSRTRDGAGTAITSINTQLRVADVVNTTFTAGQITVTTTPVIVKVGASALANRKYVSIQPVDGNVFQGSSNTITSTSGSAKVFKDQVVVKEFGATIGNWYLVAASGSVTVYVEEGS